MNIVFALIISLIVGLAVLFYYAIVKMLNDNKTLHSIDTDEDLDLTKTL